MRATYPNFLARLLSASAAVTLIVAGPVTLAPTASAQIPVVQSAPMLLSQEPEEESTDSGSSTTKWLLLSAGAGLALGGVIAGVQAYRRRGNDPRDKDRYGR